MNDWKKITFDRLFENFKGSETTSTPVDKDETRDRLKKYGVTMHRKLTGIGIMPGGITGARWIDYDRNITGPLVYDSKDNPSYCTDAEFETAMKKGEIKWMRKDTNEPISPEEALSFHRKSVDEFYQKLAGMRQNIKAKRP